MFLCTNDLLDEPTKDVLYRTHARYPVTQMADQNNNNVQIMKQQTIYRIIS